MKFRAALTHPYGIVGILCAVAALLSFAYLGWQGHQRTAAESDRSSAAACVTGTLAYLQANVPAVDWPSSENIIVGCASGIFD